MYFDQPAEVVAHSGQRAVPWTLRSLVQALFAPLAVLGAPGARRFLMAILLLDLPLQVGVHLWNRTDLTDMGALGGLNVSVTSVALLLLYLSSAVSYMGAPHGNIPTIHISRPLVLYVGIVLLSGWYAHDAAVSFFEFALFAQLLLMFIYVAAWIQSREDLIFVITLLLVGLLLEAIIMLSLVAHGSGLEIPGIRARLDVDSGIAGLPRVGGTIGAPNNAGAYLSVFLSLAAGALISGLTSRTKLLAAAGFVLGFLALLLTYSRGGLTGFAISIAVIVVASFLRKRPPIRWVFFVVLVAATAIWLLHSSLTVRWMGDDADAAYSRIPLMHLAVRIINDHPIFGVGANNFALAMNDYVDGEFRHAFLYTVHNRFLLIWAETGVVGLFAYLWFLLSTLRTGWLCWRANDPLLSPIALGMTAAIIGHMAHMMVDVFNGRPLTQTIWLLAALIVATASLLRRQAVHLAGPRQHTARQAFMPPLLEASPRSRHP